jgi:hypothetical protein
VGDAKPAGPCIESQHAIRIATIGRALEAGVVIAPSTRRQQGNSTARKEAPVPDKTTDIAQREQQRVTRREPLGASNPFRLLERFADEIDSVFDDFGSDGARSRRALAAV